MNDLDWNDYFDNDRECGGEQGNDSADADYIGADYDELDQDEV